MKRFYVVGLALVMLGCGSGDKSRVPTAHLKVPACVVAGSEVTFDASSSSDPDGSLVRYLFSVDSSTKLISNQPEISYTFSKAKVVGNEYVQYAVRLVVIDDDGFSSQAQANLFVVNNLSACPEGPVDVPDVVAQDIGYPDVEQWDSETPDVAILDIGSDSVEWDNGKPPVDIWMPDGSGVCPNLTGSYRVEVYCFGTLQLELESKLQQVGCNFADQNGVLEGSIDESSNVKLSSPFSDLKMTDCEGVYDDPEFFDVTCSSGCTAVFSVM